jgi:gliding motility-associated-like protein
MEVKPRPIDSADILFSDTAQCFDGNLFFFDHLATEPATTTWFFGDGNTALGKSVSHSYATTGIFPVRLEVLDTAGCYDEYHDTIEVITQPDNFYTGLDSAYCEGDAPETMLPNIPGGSYFGDNVDPVTGEFTPITVGYNYVGYAIVQNGCLDTFERRTEILPIPTFEIGRDTFICSGETIRYTLNPSPASTRWSTGATDTFLDITSPGLVWAELNSRGCTFRDSFQVNSIVTPSISIGSDTTMCGGGSFEVDITSDQATYTWNDGFNGPTRVISATGLYQVTVTNKCGSASDQVDVNVLPYACTIFVPNAFTPNNDKTNNTFQPTGYVDLLQMQIFNRWGEKMYDSSDPDDMSWDGNFKGERVQQGCYFYIIRYMKPEDEGFVPTLIKGEVYVLY